MVHYKNRKVFPLMEKALYFDIEIKFSSSHGLVIYEGVFGGCTAFLLLM